MDALNISALLGSCSIILRFGSPWVIVVTTGCVGMTLVIDTYIGLAFRLATLHDVEMMDHHPDAG